MNIIKNRNIFFAIAGILIIGSFLVIGIKGFRVGIDFTGGSVIEFTSNTLTTEQVREQVVGILPAGVSIQTVGEHGFSLKSTAVDQQKKEAFISRLKITDPNLVETRFNTIGPSVGSEIRFKAIMSIVLISILIVLFIAYSFRNVARPVSGWVYGIVAIAVLVHDIIIPAGFFALMGYEITTLFVVGILTILGVSINDTIVVFDRIRENLGKNNGNKGDSFESIVTTSIRETFTRSIMTSVTILLALGALYLWGPVATHDLSLVMFLGMFFGTYSSIFIAAPLLVVYNNYQMKKQNK